MFRSKILSKLWISNRLLEDKAVNSYRYLSITSYERNKFLEQIPKLLFHQNLFNSKLKNVINFQITRKVSESPALTPAEASELLREHEQTLQLQEEIESNWEEAVSIPSTHAIISVDSNQLASNTPIEDCLTSAKCLYTNGFLFGIFDGHGGPQCSQIISNRIFDYIAASLLPRSELKRLVEEWKMGSPVALIRTINNDFTFVPELDKIYTASLLRWCQDLMNSIGQEFSMEEALTSSFLRLDEDIGREVIENQESEYYETLVEVANTGSVACVVHIDGPDVHIANTGDCGAVLGEVAESHGGWIVERLTKDHNWENTSEVKRVLKEHPEEERDSVIQNQRLLGMLMPLRAFGDYKFKWSIDMLKKYMGMYDDEIMYLTQVSKSPPYLTVRPEITYHRLNAQEKFMVIGSDGLWESLGALDIVTMVGHYMSGRQTLKSIELPRRKVSLGEISTLLHKRREGLKHKPTDTNAATHLIRHCLGSTDEGLSHTRISHSLTLPSDVRRYFRDDISINVIFFDSNFIRVCPMEL